jgi:glycine hydroxymethyltransferase
MNIKKKLDELNKLCQKETKYYLDNIDLVAASNFIGPRLTEMEFYKTQRSMEGLLNKRPYAGTKYLDKIEEIGVESAKRLFGAEFVNIQPHSGSQANQAAYAAFLKPGDCVLSMKFDEGGHLTHGNPINFSGKIYKFIHYGINARSGLLDYDEVEKMAKKYRPRMIVAGASSYPRVIDYENFSKIAKKYKSYFMADIAHPVGLIAAGYYPSPFPYADVVTSGTEKTLAGPHGGIIMGKKEYENLINKAVHPGTQSSVPISRIVQLSMAFLFAETHEFKNYIQSVVENAQVLKDKFLKMDNCVLFGGTDSHFIVINVLNTFGLTGKEAESILENLGIFTNRQIIPNETRKVYDASGLRIGTPAATARGYDKEDFKIISDVIIEALSNPKNKQIQTSLSKRLRAIKKKRI